MLLHCILGSRALFILSANVVRCIIVSLHCHDTAMFFFAIPFTSLDDNDEADEVDDLSSPCSSKNLHL